MNSAKIPIGPANTKTPSHAMFDHIGINVKDVSAAHAFYTTLLAPLGYREIFALPEHEVYGFGSYHPGFWIMPGRDETRHSGPCHIAFSAKNRAQVRAFYEAGLKAGGKCNGPPGVRPQYHRWYYGAFVTDLDGHNVECVCHWPPTLIALMSWPAIAGYLGLLLLLFKADEKELPERCFGSIRDYFDDNIHNWITFRFGWEKIQILSLNMTRF